MKKLFTALVICFALSMQAQTTLMDNFNYTNDSLAAVSVNNGWIIASGVTTNALRANGTALTYSGYFASGIGNSVPMTNNGQDAVKDFNVVYTSGNVYASFMAKISASQAAGDYFFAFLPTGSTSLFGARTFAKLSSTGYYRVAISKGSVGPSETLTYSTDSFANNTTYLFVVRYSIITGTANDSVHLYVFNGGVPAVAPVTATVSTIGGINADATSISRLALRQGSASNAPSLSIGGIRVSSTWADGPLPVNFTSFKGYSNKNNNTLNWVTSSEMNNKGFEVERSLDGDNFESIGFVKGAGNSSKILSYQFNDENAQFPMAYYRLKQIDFDGKFEYSAIISISNEETQIDITPNPFVETISIVAPSQDQFVSAEIIDITGKVKTNMSGQGTLTMDTKDLNQGVYFIRVNHGEKIIVKRIIKN
ncbi:MAG: T9SS type A sorting domain-containing protein [bacterium]|nr:T9SS type A sorting domain-containing protein [bacterium]